jgi:hypothetical protein
MKKDVWMKQSSGLTGNVDRAYRYHLPARWVLLPLDPRAGAEKDGGVISRDVPSIVIVSNWMWREEHQPKTCCWHHTEDFPCRELPPTLYA